MTITYKRYAVLQQRNPRIIKGENVANLVHVGAVEAYSGKHAMDIARTWPIFKRGKDLAHWPVVQEIVPVRPILN